MSGQNINKGVTITFLGHACFKLISPHGTTILIDPWIKDNPQAPKGAENVGKLHYILVSHGHGDHLGDTIELAKKTGAPVISMPEIAHYLIQKGLNPEKIVGMNKGGSVTATDIRITMVHALHSSSMVEGNQIIYGGEAAGFIIRFDNGFTVYHAGDTGVFGDMKIISDLYKPDTCLAPYRKSLCDGTRRSGLRLWAFKTSVCDPHALWNLSGSFRNSGKIFRIDEKISRGKGSGYDSRRDH